MLDWLCTFLSLISVSAFIQTPQPSQTYAVVVGIADYRVLTYRNGDLQYADKDALKIAHFLQSRQGGNVPASHIRLLINQQATRSAIIQALALFAQANPGDRVIFYFSGHGLTDAFAPYDVRANATHTLLFYADVKKAFKRSVATTKLCIADACFAGAMIGRKSSGSSASEPSAPVVSNDHNTALLLAARSTQAAIEQQKLAGGTFTYFLLRGLAGEADIDRNSVVTIRELHDYISPRVRRITPNQQAPLFYGKFSDNLPLAYL